MHVILRYNKYMNFSIHTESFIFFLLTIPTMKYYQIILYVNYGCNFILELQQYHLLKFHVLLQISYIF